MAKHSAHLILAVLLCASSLLAQDPTPFSMPIPEGWRTETIPFPLEFAPDLPYSGLEALRFAPGMFEPDSHELWSYAFVWWIGSSEPVDDRSLARNLEIYFRGLAQAVGESRGVEVGDAVFGATIETVDNGFLGRAETFDAFVTQEQILLEIEGASIDCPEQGHRAVLFTLSPRSDDDPVWATLRSIVDGFRCSSTTAQARP